MSYPQKITFGEMRDSGVREVLVYCRDHKVQPPHHDGRGSLRLSDIEDRFFCQVCGKRGAEIRPKFSPAKMGTN